MVIPNWLASLLGEKFFNPCLLHECAKKNEKNIFCLDCCSTICPHCLPTHPSHRLLQIRRYVYHDVVRLDDVEKLMDCSFVQAYTTNSAKVIFLNQRPQTRPFRGSGNICSTCDRSLQDPYLFCSLSCKVNYLVETEGGVSNHLYECEYLPLSEAPKGGGGGGGYCYELEEDGGLMTPDSVLESPISHHHDSSWSGSSSNGVGLNNVGYRILACTATTEIVRKKRTSLNYRPPISISICCSPSSPDSEAANNRRKTTPPQRSPLY